MLDPTGLANNGGPTQTIGVEPNSPAINAGDQAVCANPPVNGVDQHGHARPGTGHTQCSIGAYEAEATAPACVGDCDGSGDVTVNELVTMVNIALGNAQLSRCTAGDAYGSGVTINELIAAVTHALNGCS